MKIFICLPLSHSLQLQVVRMMSVKDGEVPILDFQLRSGPKLIDVSLWWDEALADLKMGDQTEITHLKANVWPNGRCKMNSTSYTRVKVHNIMYNKLADIVVHPKIISVPPLNVYENSDASQHSKRDCKKSYSSHAI